jgi:hypothetical protein
MNSGLQTTWCWSSRKLLYFFAFPRRKTNSDSIYPRSRKPIAVSNSIYKETNRVNSLATTFQWIFFWLRAFALVLVLNATFPILLLFSSLLPSEVLVERVQQAFATGELIEKDYLPYNIHQGFHQYNDCNILQIMTNQDSSQVAKALGPWLRMPYSSATEACRTLRELVVDGRDPDAYASSRYTRYWHGYIPILSVLLVFLEISTLRVILRIAVYMAVLLLLLSSIREKRLLMLTCPVFISGAFFWGLPYFGQGMSHALGDIVVMLGIACLVFWHRRFAHADRLIPFCASFGAVVVYFEMLTGPLPVVAGLLFPTTYLISRLTNHFDLGINHHLRLATLALIAFTMGAVATVGVRILVAAALVHPSGLDTFAGNLGIYTQHVDSTSLVPGFLRPFGHLLRNGAVLTYGSNWGLTVLYASVALSWFVSLWLAYRNATRSGWADLLAFVIGAAGIPIWTIVLQTHTILHAGFMTRILIVPISLGWATMLWQLWLKHTQFLQTKATPLKPAN